MRSLIRGKRILLMDDVISSGGSPSRHGTAGGPWRAAPSPAEVAVLAEGEAAERSDIKFLEKLPVFHADGTVKD